MNLSDQEVEAIGAIARQRAERRTDSIHRVVIGAPLTPNELRLAGAFAIVWFAMDVAWFLGTLNHWWGL